MWGGGEQGKGEERQIGISGCWCPSVCPCSLCRVTFSLLAFVSDLSRLSGLPSYFCGYRKHIRQ